MLHVQNFGSVAKYVKRDFTGFISVNIQLRKITVFVIFGLPILLEYKLRLKRGQNK